MLGCPPAQDSRKTTRIYQDDIIFLVGNPHINRLICHCYWEGGQPKFYLCGQNDQKKYEIAWVDIGFVCCHLFFKG